MKSRALLISVLVSLLVGVDSTVFSEEPSEVNQLTAAISRDRLVASVRALAAFDGRQSGTEGGESAADYISERLPEAARQTFPIKTVVVTSPVKAEIQSAEVVKPLRNGVDFLPILNGASASQLSCPVVFVGYGIADPENGLDEYRNVSVTGKFVLFLRGQPTSYRGRFVHLDKERAAKARGAVGYLTVTGPMLSAYEQRRGMSTEPMAYYGEGDSPLPGLWITPALGNLLLKPISVTLELFQQESRSRSIETESTITLSLQQRRLTSTATNVVGHLSGSVPQLQQETVILGAHYDHFGNQGGILFPGADDNASGTAVLLEVARILTGKARTKRSIIFIAFAGEEQGLLGSKMYTMHPALPLDAASSMINVDHVAAGNGRIAIGLSGIEKSLAQAAAEGAGLRDRIELFGFFPGGDHVPFNEAGIPTAAIFSSGAHPDFHRPSDTPERISPDILVLAARYTLAVLLTLANLEP
jgi:hypothetical protein